MPLAMPCPRMLVDKSWAVLVSNTSEYHGLFARYCSIKSTCKDPANNPARVDAKASRRTGISSLTRTP